MLAKQIQKSFPKGVSIPAELQALCEFAEENDGDVSGLFELEPDGASSAKAWFNNNTRRASQFAVFGLGPDGSLYALWLHAGKDASIAPVVYLGSEGGALVIANDFRDFLQLLAVGYEEPGRSPSLEPEMVESAQPLHQWLKQKFKIAPPRTGKKLVEKAVAAHPNLAEWIAGPVTAKAKRSQPASQPVNAASYLDFLGVDLKAVLADPLIKKLRGKPDIARDPELHQTIATFESAGLELYANTENQVSTIMMSAGDDDYGTFPGELPCGLSFADGQKEVRKKLGKPASSQNATVDKILGPEPAFDYFEKTEVHVRVAYTADLAATCAIHVMTPNALEE